MTDVFYLRRVDPPITLADLPTMAAQSQGCFGLHRVQWRMSFLAGDGSEMLCWYRAPDAESARIALRQLGADMSGIWPGKPEPPIDDMPAASLADVSALAVATKSLPQHSRDAVIAALESRGGQIITRLVAFDASQSVWVLSGVAADEVAAIFSAGGVQDVRAWDCSTFVPEPAG